MKVALFVPCYVDQLFARVAWATVALLERLGCEVSFDPAQACCGQPFLTAGHPDAARALARRWLDVFERAEHVVAPSASCVATVRRHYAHLSPGATRTGSGCTRAATACASCGSARAASGRSSTAIRRASCSARSTASRSS